MKTRTPALRRTLLAASLALVVGAGIVAPAFADADDWHRSRGEAREHAWRDHDRWDHRAFVAPSYAYTYPYPAPAYGYVPAPAYPAPGVTFGFTFR
jgi:hypothetical protein